MSSYVLWYLSQRGGLLYPKQTIGPRDVSVNVLQRTLSTIRVTLFHTLVTAPYRKRLRSLNTLASHYYGTSNGILGKLLAATKLAVSRANYT